MNEVFTVELPIVPKDVFRLLALRCITETSGLFKKIREHFEDISNGIHMTPRLNESEFGRKPFDYKHQGLDVAETSYIRMTERQLCAAKTAFFDKNYPEKIGKVIDYELPLDDKKDSAFGKVDLVSVNADTMFLLEVKKCESNEHPLRAMFEIFTFWKTLASEEGLYDCFLDAYRSSHPQVSSDVGCVLPALLLCNDSDIMKYLKGEKDGLKGDFDQRELCKMFLSEGIGMKVFSYDKDSLLIEDETQKVLEGLCC